MHETQARWPIPKKYDTSLFSSAFFFFNDNSIKQPSFINRLSGNDLIWLEPCLFLFQVTFSVCYPSCPWCCPLSKQATHPNMRTYYFCTDTAKEMESWMKVMTEAALVQAEPVKRFVRAPVKETFLQRACILFEVWRLQWNSEKKKLKKGKSRTVLKTNMIDFEFLGSSSLIFFSAIVL